MAVPTAPRTFVATGTATGQIYLTWVAPLTPGGNLTNYKIYTGSAKKLLVTVGTTVLNYPYVVSDNSQPVYFTITATNATGEGAGASVMWSPVAELNYHNYVGDSMNMFVFTLSGASGTGAYNLSSFLKGFQVIGCAQGCSAAADSAWINNATKLVTTATTNTVSLTVYALKRGGA